MPPPVQHPASDAYIYELAQKLWDYHHMHQPLRKADAILVLCSHDTRVAERAAQLFLEEWAPLLIFSGGLGVITRSMWSEPEADLFARIAIGRGVPTDRILIENQSTNTGENILFTKRLLAEKKLDPQTFIVVQKPYMERRSYATFRKVWPEKQLIVTSPQDPFAVYLSQYTNPELSPDDVISIMVGDLQRIRLYPEKGFQIPQAIPDDVWAAYEELVQAGYNRHLVVG
ncbi:YdcF family protein [Nibrella viscosa]|uniref:YdcF family protein n=1 Tax=Nibrella viscosa TaxID=1084524 RepID=A0ABP8JSI3_9BACT